ncbi:phosphate-binding protein [Alicyclobacillus cellulosilyticus]|uniref:Phosphate-binding protein n=1 Tax=Alicyclobacillus cellulosilyticus TaxID=1003997 RepID=A0A917K7N2_9BACL|nr:phosphate ABC transporter substrate-binding protein PstS [Alicyclobacillus cellulosilyticus]GGJ04083.1 phosphate-binding protein [Alicyclobacillus cellulosilyticus]
MLRKSTRMAVSGLTLAALVAATGGVVGAKTLAHARKADTVKTLTGAGSTFDYPFFSRAFYVYQQKTGVQVNYQSIGSGAGIEQFSAGTVDFGATDVPMNSDEVKKAQAHGGPVIQIPITLGGVAMAYNLPSVKQQLKFTPKALADIYLGKVKKWNDPEITSVNKGVKLPNLPIVVVHRSDGSGTSYIFTDYLSSVSSEWAKKVGKGKSVNWPVGIGAKGNEAVATSVRNTQGAIGYVELAYAMQTKMTYGLIQNKAGVFVAPTPKSIAAAAATKPNVSATNFSIVNAPGKDSYPISGFSWVLLYRHYPDAAKEQALVKLFQWMETDGQNEASAVNYVPLPQNIRDSALAKLDTMH